MLRQQVLQQALEQVLEQVRLLQVQRHQQRQLEQRLLSPLARQDHWKKQN